MSKMLEWVRKVVPYEISHAELRIDARGVPHATFDDYLKITLTNHEVSLEVSLEGPWGIG